jgi:predicted ABC-type ATPase
MSAFFICGTGDLLPHVIVIAGPNGAGKSTTAPKLLKEMLGVTEFVNADTIAEGLSAFNPEGAAFEAGRIMLRRLHSLADEQRDFAFETTLATRSYARWLKKLRDQGYTVHLFFFWLPSPEYAIARVAERVRMGGHNVPEETIRRRYQAGLRNFFDMYRHLADSWYMFDNSAPGMPLLIASYDQDDGLVKEDEPEWACIVEGM